MDDDELAQAMGFVVQLAPDQLRLVMAHCAGLHAFTEGVTATQSVLATISAALPTNPSEVIADVARRHGVTVADLVGPSRKRPMVEARWEAMRELRTRTGLSLKQIAGRVGRHDHTTVRHALLKAPPKSA